MAEADTTCVASTGSPPRRRRLDAGRADCLGSEHDPCRDDELREVV